MRIGCIAWIDVVFAQGSLASFMDIAEESPASTAEKEMAPLSVCTWKVPVHVLLITSHFNLPPSTTRVATRG